MKNVLYFYGWRLVNKYIPVDQESHKLSLKTCITLCGRKLEKYVINYWYMTLNNVFFICVYFVCIDIYETLSLIWISINPCAEWLRHTRIYQISSCYNNYSILESPFLMPLPCYIWYILHNSNERSICLMQTLLTIFIFYHYTYIHFSDLLYSIHSRSKKCISWGNGKLINMAHRILLCINLQDFYKAHCMKTYVHPKIISVSKWLKLCSQDLINTFFTK